MEIPSDTASVLTSITSLLMRRGVHSTPITAMARCAQMETWEDDHWEQPGNLFRKMTPEQKQLLFDNTARAINDASQEVLERHVANCRRADPAYGDGVARALKLNVLKAA